MDAQEKGNNFTYSWLSILISFVAWVKPSNYQGMEDPGTCLGKGMPICGLSRIREGMKTIILNFICM